jgi:2,4-dienoyl-CoA reductase-like NADH-dependent reductase (Old Yellow Enzyme family)
MGKRRGVGCDAPHEGSVSGISRRSSIGFLSRFGQRNPVTYLRQVQGTPRSSGRPVRFRLLREREEVVRMSALFEPGRIGNIELRNRFVRSATVECLCTEDGRVTDAYLRVYERLAKGGVALIVPGNYLVNRLGCTYPMLVTVDRDEVIDDLRRVVSAVHARGAKIVAQLNHGGRQSDPRLIGGRPIAPSPVRDKLSFVKPRQMTGEEIEQTISDFGEGARRIKDAGFDGVQIHAAHGYLINQFLSAYTNRRRDEWGGSTENRMRFLLEVYRAVRSRVGADFPILVKVNCEDSAKNGVHLEECVEHCKRLDQLGIAAIEVSGGIAEKGLATIKGDFPMDLALEGRGPVEGLVLRMLEGRLKEAARFQEAYFLPQAAAIKKNVRAPILAVGGMRTRKTMEAALEKGQADFVSMSRPFIRHPNLVNLLERREGDPITCSSCNRCSLEILLHSKPLRCYKDRRGARGKAHSS